MVTVSDKLERIGGGKIVPRRFQQERARDEFFFAMEKIVPEAFEALNASSFADTDRGQLGATIRAWGERWQLTDYWVFDAVLMTVTREVRASSFAGRMASWIPSIGPYSLAEGQIITLLVDGSGGSELVDPYAITVEMLGLSSGWEIIRTNPRTETVDDATARSMRVLEPLVRGALNDIRERDRVTGNNTDAQPLPTRQYFEWTVRYQCLGESFGKITRDEGLSNENNWVSEKVREIAKLIGLTLREPDTGGRPRKQPPARNSRCIAIPHKRESSCPEQ